MFLSLFNLLIKKRTSIINLLNLETANEKDKQTPNRENSTVLVS